MKIIICDGCKEDRALLLRYINRYIAEKRLETLLEQYPSSKNLLAARGDISEDTVLFLALCIDGSDGMEAAHALRKAGFHGSIVFVASSPDYAFESYRVDAQYYALKPLSYEELDCAMERCRARWEPSQKRIVLRADRVEQEVLMRDIEFVEAAGHCCMLHTERGGALRTCCSLSTLWEKLRLDPGFMRIGRAFIVNLSYFSRCGDEAIFLKSGAVIPLPIRERSNLRKQIISYYWTSTRP